MTSKGVTLHEQARQISPLTLSLVLRRPKMKLRASATPLAPNSSTSRKGINTSPRKTSWPRRDRPYTDTCKWSAFVGESFESGTWIDGEFFCVRSYFRNFCQSGVCSLLQAGTHCLHSQEQCNRHTCTEAQLGFDPGGVSMSFYATGCSDATIMLMFCSAHSTLQDLREKSLCVKIL